MKHHLLTALTAAVLCTSIPVSAEDEKPHPIDAKITKLSDAAKSTADTTAAYTRGLVLWDAEMNRVYEELKKALPEASFAKLRDSQKQWLVFRDAQIKFIDSCYDQYDGTMYIPMRASAIMEVTRARALDLTARLEVHKEHAPQ
jgi:uncharacterized protein YecT (DUF1311 family)